MLLFLNYAQLFCFFAEFEKDRQKIRPCLFIYLCSLPYFSTVPVIVLDYGNEFVEGLPNCLET